MPAIYRSMKVVNSKPFIANQADGLGVRIGNGPNDDIPVTQSGKVNPGTGGMSVAPNWRELPVHRIPSRLRAKHPAARGKDQLSCWRMGEGDFADGHLADGLELRLDSERHGLVEPEERTLLERYLGQLAATVDEWVIDED